MKTVGYLISTVSVLLLGLVSLRSALHDPGLFPILLAGMATSICGMFLRWLSHRKEKREQRARQPAASQ